MANGSVAYSSEFPTPDSDSWIALVERTLKGKPFDKAMTRRTADGIEFPVLHTSLPNGAKPQPVRDNSGWYVTSPHWGSDAKTINGQLLTDLERGASSVAITVGTQANGLSSDDLGAALDGVYLDLVPVTLIQGSDFEQGCDALHELIAARNHERGTLAGCLGIDPIGNFARDGSLEDVEGPLALAAEIAQKWSAKQPGIATFTADGTVVANAGGTEVQELTFALSSAVAYLRAMEDVGMSCEVAASQIQFTLSADANLWSTIAKFRVARRLWGQILNACGVKNVGMRLNAVSAVYSVTKRDPWVNILRGTAACFAAGVAGADHVTTLPHDLMLGTTDDFSRRIARNIQMVLLEESNLGQVNDPAAGSFAIETLTNQVHTAAVTAFQTMEASGGVVAALKDGTLAAEIENAATQRADAVATRKNPITGVSEFPDIAEGPLPSGPDFVSDARLPLRRPAAAYEDLRSRSDKILSETGNRPKVFLANIGTPAEFTARATFAKNFFEAGGVVAVAGEGGDSTDVIRNQYNEADAEIAVLCGTDKQYQEVAVPLASALKAAGCKRVFLAGSPNSAPDGAAVDDFAYMGANVIETVLRAYDAIAGEGEAS